MKRKTGRPPKAWMYTLYTAQGTEPFPRSSTCISWPEEEKQRCEISRSYMRHNISVQCNTYRYLRWLIFPFWQILPCFSLKVSSGSSRRFYSAPEVTQNIERLSNTLHFLQIRKRFQFFNAKTFFPLHQALSHWPQLWAYLPVVGCWTWRRSLRSDSSGPRDCPALWCCRHAWRSHHHSPPGTSFEKKFGV